MYHIGDYDRYVLLPDLEFVFNRIMDIIGSMRRCSENFGYYKRICIMIAFALFFFLFGGWGLGFYFLYFFLFMGEYSVL